MAEGLGQSFARSAANFMEDHSFLGRIALGVVSFFALDKLTDIFVDEEDGVADAINPLNDFDEILAGSIKWAGSIFAAWGLFNMVQDGLEHYGGEEPTPQNQPRAAGLTP